MNNNALNSDQEIKINLGETYFVIDPLYVSDIKVKLSNSDCPNLDADIRKVFPYTKIPFSKYYAREAVVRINQVKKLDYSEKFGGNPSVFCIDSGSFILINESIFWEFIKDFDYDDLYNGSEIIDFSYWKDLSLKYGEGNIGLIIAPGINSGFEFDGDGTYTIDEGFYKSLNQ